MNRPSISIITPSFNQGKYIKQTIESVLSQNYPKLEYYVIDGGSSDETISILKSYGTRIRWLSERDEGQSAAINKGLKLARGELIGYLNSDDLLLPGALERIGKYYTTHKADWITGDCLVINEKGEKIAYNSLIRFYKRMLLRLYSPTTLMIADNMLPQPSTFWSRRALKRVGLMNPDYHYVMDYDYWLRLSQYYRPHDLGIALSAFRVHGESKSETNRAKLMAEGEKALVANGAKAWQLRLHTLHSHLVWVIYNMLKK